MVTDWLSLSSEVTGHSVDFFFGIIGWRELLVIVQAIKTKYSSVQNVNIKAYKYPCIRYYQFMYFIMLLLLANDPEETNIA